MLRHRGRLAPPLTPRARLTHDRAHVQPAPPRGTWRSPEKEPMDHPDRSREHLYREYSTHLHTPDNAPEQALIIGYLPTTGPLPAPGIPVPLFDELTPYLLDESPHPLYALISTATGPDTPPDWHLLPADIILGIPLLVRLAAATPTSTGHASLPPHAALAVDHTLTALREFAPGLPDITPPRDPIPAHSRHHPTDQDADDRLIELAEELGLQPEDLDEDIHDEFSQRASDVNNGGLEAQISHLRTALGGEQPTADRLRELAEHHPTPAPRTEPEHENGNDTPPRPTGQPDHDPTPQ